MCLPFSLPSGERGRVRGKNVRKKFSEFDVQELKKERRK
jgi:hypothetical protein